MKEGPNRVALFGGDVQAVEVAPAVTGVGAAAHASRRSLMVQGPWPIGVGTAIAAALLILAFQQVVSQIALQGELRRQAQAEFVQASWRCRALADAPSRLDCLARLVPVSSLSPAPVAPR